MRVPCRESMCPLMCGTTSENLVHSFSLVIINVSISSETFEESYCQCLFIKRESSTFFMPVRLRLASSSAYLPSWMKSSSCQWVINLSIAPSLWRNLSTAGSSLHHTSEECTLQANCTRLFIKHVWVWGWYRTHTILTNFLELYTVGTGNYCNVWR